MEEGKSRRPHVVCVPFPAQGHVIPMMQLAKLLHSKGFCITFVNTEFNHQRLLRSRAGDDDWVNDFDGFWFQTISDGLPPSDNPDATQNPTLLCYHLPKHCLGPFRSLLGKLNSSPEVNPPVTCVISDGVMSFALTAAAELGVPGIQFWTASACGFMAYLHYDELVHRGLFPFKDESFWSDGSLEREVEWIAGMRNMRLKDLPSFIRTTDPNHIIFNFMRTETQNCLQSAAIIFNTFHSFEHEVLEAIIASKFPRVFTIGPLSLLPSGTAHTQLSSFRPSFWPDDAACLQWLDRREPGSVVYVNYGSVTVMSDRHLTEFAWGLANSNRSFLWIVRPDVVMGDSAVLSEEFLEEVKDRGLLASWCPQERVLSHPAVAVFLTHCGWNSTVESVSAGVPVICWPFFAEQQTNCRYACTDGWGIGMEIDEDVRRDEVAAVVKEMMEGERGKRMKRNAVEWKKKAEAATNVGGTSYNDFERFIKEYIC